MRCMETTCCSWRRSIRSSSIFSDLRLRTSRGTLALTSAMAEVTARVAFQFKRWYLSAHENGYPPGIPYCKQGDLRLREYLFHWFNQGKDRSRNLQRLPSVLHGER